MPAGKTEETVKKQAGELAEGRLSWYEMSALPAVTLSTAYLPPVSFFALWMHSPATYLEQYEYYEKQSYRNRCRIASPSGIQELIIPVERPSGNRTLIRDVRLSDHGNWLHQHWKAIEAAYQSAPYFEYLADDIKAVYDQPGEFLWDFNLRLTELLGSWLETDKGLHVTSAFGRLPEPNLSLRQQIHPKKAELIADFPPYYQVFAAKTGFLPNLSILDLLMNCGNEAILYLNAFKNHRISVFL